MGAMIVGRLAEIASRLGNQSLQAIRGVHASDATMPLHIGRAQAAESLEIEGALAVDDNLDGLVEFRP